MKHFSSGYMGELEYKKYIKENNVVGFCECVIGKNIAIISNDLMEKIIDNSSLKDEFIAYYTFVENIPWEE